MTEEENQALSALIPMILEYQDDVKLLEKITFEAQKAFGNDWRSIVPPLLEQVKNANNDKLKENFHHILDYESAIAAWNEANMALIKDTNPTHLQARLASFEHWLPMFGDAGTEVLAKLQEKLTSLRQAPAASSANGDISAPPAPIAGFAEDISWTFQYFSRLRNYYDQTVSRIGARCVQLGGIEMSQYKHYGYLLDILDELIELGEKLLSDPQYISLVANQFPEGKKGLEKAVAEYKKELQNNAPPEMVDDGLNADKLKAELGELDTSADNMPIGPAPDGFEPIPDLGASAPAPAPAMPTEPAAPAMPTETAPTPAPAQTPAPAPAAPAPELEPEPEPVAMPTERTKAGQDMLDSTDRQVIIDEEVSPSQSE